MDRPGGGLGPNERQKAELQRIKEDIYCIVYVGSRLSMEKGQDPDTIRAENMALATDEDDREKHGEYAYEDTRANVQAAVEDAIAGRPPRYTRGITDHASKRWGLKAK